MYKWLGVAAALCVAGPALAKGGVIASVDHAVIDFEEYQVGDVLTEIPRIGEPMGFLSFTGVIEGDGGNKWLRLIGDPLDGALYFETRNLTVGGAKNGAIVLSSTTHSIDIFTVPGGEVRQGSGGGNALIALIPANIWSTVQIGYHTDGDSRLKFYRPTNDPVLIDNFVYSASVSPVPEPTTWAFLLVGFGMVGASMRSVRHRPHIAMGVRP